MRVLFAGSPAIAVPSLKVISELELEGKIPLGQKRGKSRQKSYQKTDAVGVVRTRPRDRTEKEVSGESYTGSYRQQISEG